MESEGEQRAGNMQCMITEMCLMLWLCGAAGCTGVCHLLASEFNAEMCLIKKIPLKSAMECWISFVGSVCEEQREAPRRINVRKLEMFDRQRGGWVGGAPAQSMGKGVS